MDEDAYYLDKAKKANDAHRTGWHPANNHREKNWPSIQELQETQRLVFPEEAQDYPLVLMGGQYCRSCFDIIARVTCDNCLWGKESTAKCPHLTQRPQASPTREYCDWCYYQLYLSVLSREANYQPICGKCQEVSRMRVLTYQNDTILFICDNCQEERLLEFRRTMLDAARNQIERDLLSASEWEAYE